MPCNLPDQLLPTECVQFSSKTLPSNRISRESGSVVPSWHG